MGFLEDFFEKKDEKIIDSSLFKLKQEFEPGGRTVHLFVEDEDDFLFYGHFTKQVYVNFKIFHYPEKGKKNVIDTYSKVDWKKYPKNRLLFFVDKDYDDILTNQIHTDGNIFYTRYYSIENYLVCDEILKIIVSDIFQCKEKKIVDQIIETSGKQYTQFVKVLSLITAWILVYRRKNQNAELDGLSYDHFFVTSTLELRCKRYLPEDRAIAHRKRTDIPGIEKAIIRENKTKAILEQRANALAEHYTHNEGLKEYREITKIADPKIFLRGKYELWFLTEYFFKGLKRFFNEFNERATEYNKKPENSVKIQTYSAHTEINSRNAFFVLTSKITIPKELSLFLTSNFNPNGNN